MRKNIMACAVVILLCSLPALAQETTVVEEVIVKVNEDIITLSDFNKIYKPMAEIMSNNLSGEELETALERNKKQLFNQFINRNLIFQRARKYSLQMPQSYFDNYINDLKGRIGANSDEEFQKALTAQGIDMQGLREYAELNFLVIQIYRYDIQRELLSSESKIQEYYEDNISRYTKPAEIRLSQIILSHDTGAKEQKREEALQVLADIKTGRDFGEIYRSVTPQAPPDSDGDIGIVDESSMREEMREAIKDLEQGQVSELIEIPGAFIIVKINEKEPATEVPLEEIRERVVNDMQQDAMIAGMKKLIVQYKEESFIEIKAAEFLEYYEKADTNLGIPGMQ